MGDALRVDAHLKGVARGGTKRWHGTFVPDVTGRRYYPFKLVIFGKYRFEKPITLFPHCAHSHPVGQGLDIFTISPFTSCSCSGTNRGVPGGETDKSNPENGTGDAAAFQWEKKRKYRGLPLEGSRDIYIERESQVNHPSIFGRSNLWVSRVARFDVYRDIFEVMDDGWKRETELVGGAGRKRGSQFFEWRVPSVLGTPDKGCSRRVDEERSRG